MKADGLIGRGEACSPAGAELEYGWVVVEDRVVGCGEHDVRERDAERSRL